MAPSSTRMPSPAQWRSLVSIGEGGTMGFIAEMLAAGCSRGLVARMEPPGPAGACHRAGPPGLASGRPDGRLRPDPVGRPDDKLREIRDRHFDSAQPIPDYAITRRRRA